MSTLSSRREPLFIYDIRMGNPNGDPDENRPRSLPDGRFYVTDVRLKRFARDYLAAQGQEILVGNIEGRTTNLTGRVAHHLEKVGKAKANGEELVNILLDAFIDARWFGSSLAFKKQDDWEPKPLPKTLTGAVQFNMGEVLHEAEEIQIQGTSVFGSDEEKKQGTFTNYAALRYALIAFHGIANEHAAKKSRMTDADYDALLRALWNGVRSAGNTRTKIGQVPRLLLSVEYQPGEEFQFGNLMDYVKLQAATGKPERAWASPDDYRVDLSRLLERLNGQRARIAQVRYELSPDLQFVGAGIPGDWRPLGFDQAV
ncbi:MAG: type I-B CRISPR-associated protein Cas7/Csh2 [Candidatus Competibacteraceae bacterium]|nr:type I-B CRISPR-associated protein Cas7/Csh2 [Candidatus Competibacteraceae bacterium]MCB1770751.1 type I-B CRISPR-associated protein Cas7/Csh2 [Candidatus Competibacteraceae bacterium]MCP5125957.1 type I-B CRISPR-associated protein Cas7/Csh2 [Gammaproteobacteria bacterium]